MHLIHSFKATHHSSLLAQFRKKPRQVNDGLAHDMGDTFWRFPVISDIPGYEKTHWYCLTYLDKDVWTNKSIILVKGTAGAKEVIIKNLQWQHDPTSYWVGGVAYVFGRDFSWQGAKLTAGTGRIINLWHGLDPDEAQDFHDRIIEMDTRVIAKGEDVCASWSVYLRLPAGSTLTACGSLVTFDTYVKYVK